MAGTAVLLVGMLWAAAGADDAARTETDLARLVREMDERQAVLQEIVREERSITRALGELDEAMARLDARAAELDARVARTQQQVADAELDAARLTRELEEAEAALTRRLRGMMWLGPQADLQMMLGARSMRDLVWTRHVLRQVAEHDAALVERVQARREALLHERARLRDLQGRLAQERGTLEGARRAAAATRVSRAASLMAVGLRKGAAQQRIDELNAARRRLRDLMDDLPPAQNASGFAALKGQLRWPTDGAVDVPFGVTHERAGTEVMHSGVSINAPLGQKVVAVARGRVVHAGWLRGFGQLLIVDHGDGYHTLLAHLSRMVVQAGDEVAEGDVIAFVGDSESLVGPRLYFELRARGRPVDPVRWLRR
ncbi:MAG: peptidoglycan DD-metalloendopeptidase family protein [Deltaproteobacteria bacterium]|nr:peptidoglycan DD-metalloendopeptidase family protein [Deltaproteobacteria bacterium]